MARIITATGPTPLVPLAASSFASRRLLLVASHPLLRSGLASLLAERADIEVVAEADPSGAARLAEEMLPEVILFAGAPESEASVAIVRLGTELSIPVLVVAEEADSEPGGAPGASGWLQPDATPGQIAAAVHAVAAGLFVTTSPPAPAVEEPGNSRSNLEAPLTDREMQVLQLVARGLLNKQVARRLNISEHTVKFHVGSILGKLGAASRTETVTQAAHRGLLTL